MGIRTRSEVARSAARRVRLAAALALGVLNAPAHAELAVAIEFQATGASAETLAHRIAPRYENLLRAIDGLDFAASIAAPERLEIVLKFKHTVDPRPARAETETRLAQARKYFPPEVGVPRVAEIDAAGTRVLLLGFTSEARTAAELTRVAEEIAKFRLQEVVGVAAVRVLGARREEVHIRIDAARLAAYGVSLEAISAALRRQRLEVRTESDDAAAPILAVPLGRGDLVRALADLIVGERRGVAIRLGDVARVEIGLRSDGVLARFDGRPAVILEVLRREAASSAEVARALRNRLDDILPLLPAELRAKAGFFCARCVAARAR